ncbi:MAG: putative hemolysin [Planctomycetota bacterium]
MSVGLEALPMLGLLMLSACFSASETALFSLDEDAREGLSARARRLLDEPRDVLITILLGNLLVNVLFFALAPLLLPGSGILVGAVALLALLILGEILPKTLALRLPQVVLWLTARPLALGVRVMGPVRRQVNAFLEFAMRALGEDQRSEMGISSEALGEALEHSASEGALALREADLLGEIVEVSSLRVREIMTPRMDVLALDLLEDAQEHARVAVEAGRRRITWLPVVRGDMDTVVGAVELRDLLTRPEAGLDSMTMPVCCVPEVAPVLSMLATLREERVAEALVVDEWGGTAGVVSLEDLFEEIVGDLRVEDEEPQKLVIPLGEGRYRVQGELSIRDWNDLLGARVVPNEFETVGGYVLACLGHLPRAGDRVELGAGLVGEVHEVRGRRVQTVDLFLEEVPR